MARSLTPKRKGFNAAVLNRPFASSVTMSIGSYTTQSVDLSPPSKYSPVKEWSLRELNIYPDSISFIYQTKQKRLGVSYVWGIGTYEDTLLSASMTSPLQHSYNKPIEFPSWVRVTVEVTNSCVTNPGSVYVDYLWSEW